MGHPLQKGKRIVLDFGDHQVGYLTLKLGVKGFHADAPVRLRLHFAENPVELFEDPDEYHGWICSSWIEEEVIHVDILPGTVVLPRRYAFRYVQIEVLDISSRFSLLVEAAYCRAVSSADDAFLLPYRNENPLYRRLDEIACRTLHNCMQTVFEDGPKRDRRLWMGDLRIQARANYETYRKNDLVRECLYLFAALPTQSGQVGGCIFLEPEPEVDDAVMLDYSLFFVSTLLDYYKATGDRETLQDLWPTALSQLYLAEGLLTDQDLIRDSDEIGWCFIDWNLSLNKQGAIQGVFLYALRAGMELAGILEENDVFTKLEAIWQSCRNAADRFLWNDEEACYTSGSDAQISVATQVWMVLGGAIEGGRAAELLKRTEQRPDAVKMVSPYMVHNYVDALICAGEEDAAIAYMCRYWGGMADQGADTFWELYNPENPQESPYGGTIVNSYCHAWSCGPAYFLRKYRP
ncbi:MAG: cellobiose phosphorylase [Lachnospiraceae bacterium]|nr:cellobiose phosphorylase [Lachnospiraceae bacterium]